MGDTFSLKITDKVLYIQYLDRSRYDSTDLFRVIQPVFAVLCVKPAFFIRWAAIVRGTQIPTRWLDHGAAQALPVFQVATRLQSGLLEVVLKQHISDRTDWRKMLKADALPLDLKTIRDELLDKCSNEIAKIKSEQGDVAIQAIDEDVVEINYPVSAYPEKIKSLNFDKQPEIEGALKGIKGQYLILDSGVLNIRKFSGYKIEVDFV